MSKIVSKSAPKIVTANLLRTGAVVYLASDGRWVSALDAAAVVEDAAALARMQSLAEAALTRREVVAVYAFDVRLAEGRPEPISVRERLRAAHANAPHAAARAA